VCTSLFEGEIALGVIAILGLSVSLAGYQSISAARRASESLRDIFEKQFDAPSQNLAQNFAGQTVVVISDKVPPSPILLPTKVSPSPILLPTVTGGGNRRNESRGQKFAQIVPIIITILWSISISYSFYRVPNFFQFHGPFPFSYSCSFGDFPRFYKES